jgi:DNA polymerase-3 subunit epsilon
MIKIFYDVETTGLNPKLHSIHQLAGIVEVDGSLVEEFNYTVRPHPKAEITKEAMSVCKKSEKEIRDHHEMSTVHKRFLKMLSKYVSKYDAKQKIHLVGFNNRCFDDLFLRAFFELNGDKFMGSWFWPDSLDVLCLASEYLQHRRSGMPSFKLKRVAKEIGLEVDQQGLHDALFDARLTRNVYRIVTGLEFEI